MSRSVPRGEHRRRHPPGPARRRRPGQVYGGLGRLRRAAHPWGPLRAYADLAERPATVHSPIPVIPGEAAAGPPWQPLLALAQVRPGFAPAARCAWPSAA
jgi:hypothetical protein